MGYVQATIELINGWEAESARKGLMDKDEVRRMYVETLVDTGAISLCINEIVRDALQLPLKGEQKSVMANGAIIMCDVVGPVDLYFENRSCTMLALVLPGDNQCLLGALALEMMDILVDPKRQKLVVNPEHPEFSVFRISAHKTGPLIVKGHAPADRKY